MNPSAVHDLSLSVRQALVPVLIALSMGSAGAAQLGSLPPFAGEGSEGFETQHTLAGGQHPPGGTPILVGGLFDGAATLTATSPPFLIQLHGSTVATCGSASRTGYYQASGFLCALSLVFDADQAAFGGYFASDTVDPQNGTTREWNVEFLDSLGVQIGGDIMVLNAPCGTSSWFGWSLPAGTRRIDFEPVVPFRTLIMDDLVASPSAPLGEVYCPGAETSVGTRGSCRASGSLSVAGNALTLHAERLPPNTFGFFLASRTAGFVANPGGSSGNLCLGGAIGRYVGPGEIQNSGAGGALSLPIDLSAIAQPSGPVAATAAEDWHFQAWFRDVTTGGLPMPTSNFTGGLALTLQP